MGVYPLTNLELAKDALAELRASSGYKAAKRDNPNSFGSTHIGRCEADLVQLITNLSAGSPSASASPSLSPSASVSASPSPVPPSPPSSSRSPSPSPSASVSRSASPSASVSPSSAPQPGTLKIPKYGFATGAIYAAWDTNTMNYVLDRCKEAAHGKPFAVRYDCWAYDSKFIAMTNGCIARGLTPWIVMYGTSGPRSTVDGVVSSVAGNSNWKGKIIYTSCNEQDIHGWTPTQCASFQVTLYKAIKAQDPSAVVGTGGHWKGNTYKIQEYAAAYATQAKGYFDFFNFHGYDDPTATAQSWCIWAWVFPGGYYPTNNTCKGILQANGVNVPIVSDECGSKATGSAQSAAEQKLLNEAYTGVHAVGCYIFSPLQDYDPGWQVIDQSGSTFTPRQAYTDMVNFIGGH